jgi:rod shape determining protein RodA
MEKIQERLQQSLKGIPWGLVFVTYIIILLGIFNLYSASGLLSQKSKFFDQIKWVFLGTGALIFWGIVINLKMIQKLTWLAYFLICAVLALINVVGITSKGAQRWLTFGNLNLQPSELAKVVMILAISKCLTHSKFNQGVKLIHLWKEVLIIGVPVVFIMLQPDLGTSSLIILVALFQFCLIKIPFKNYIWFGLTFLCTVFLSWHFFLYDYQKERILNFIYPQRDPQGSGYQSIQSMVAVGSGQLWGKGFLKGTQSHLQFLPERHTDFILSVWAEEQGFMGSLLLFTCYLVLLFLMLRIAEQAKDPFGILLTVGIIGFFAAHIFINTFMVLGIFPIVGVPLSLMSYGGSHFLTTMSCIGLLVSVAKHKHAKV